MTTVRKEVTHQSGVRPRKDVAGSVSVLLELGSHRSSERVAHAHYILKLIERDRALATVALLYPRSLIASARATINR